MDKYDFSDANDVWNMPGSRFYRLVLYFAKAIYLVPFFFLTHLGYSIIEQSGIYLGKFISMRDLTDEEMELLRYRSGRLIYGRDYEEYAMMLIVGVLLWILCSMAVVQILESSSINPFLAIVIVPISLLFLSRILLWICGIVKM